MAILTQRGQLAVQAKNSQDGTFATITGSDVIDKVYNATPTITQEQFDRNPVSPYNGPVGSVPGSKSASVTFDVEVRGSGTAGTAPNIGTLLKGHGLVETVSAATSVTYEPADDPTGYTSGGPNTIDTEYIEDGNAVEILDGAVTALSITGSSNEIAVANMTIQGAYEGESGGNSFYSYTPSTIVPPPFKGITATFNGVALDCPTNFTFDTGATGQLIECATQTDGYKGAEVTQHIATMQIDFRAQAFGTFNPFTQLYAGTQAAFVLTWGTTAGNIITIRSDNAQVLDVTPEEVGEGVRSYSRTFGFFQPEDGTAAFQIIFT